MVLQVSETGENIAIWRKVETAGQIHIRLLPECLQEIINGAVGLVLELNVDAGDGHTREIQLKNYAA